MQKWQSLHLPFRTSRELGFTQRGECGKPDTPGLMPFVTASGTWWSHIMIVREPWPWG